MASGFRCSTCECGGHEECTICNPPTVLQDAARLVHGDRQVAYGHPRDNHACTAAMWTAYIERRYGSETCGLDKWLGLDGYDVCMLNILQKVSRLAHTRHRDGLVDIAGFARNAELVEDDL